MTDSTSADCQYPRDYTDRQLLESIWRKLDGLAKMLGPQLFSPPPPENGCSTCGHIKEDHCCLLDQCCMQCACGGFKENL